MNLSTAEQLALAVLRGDADAALALADAVLETYHGTSRRVPMTRLLTVDRERLRVAVFLKNDTSVGDMEDAQRFRNNVNRWLAGDRAYDPALLNGIDRIELFELPVPEATITAVPDGGVTMLNPSGRSHGLAVRPADTDKVAAARQRLDTLLDAERLADDRHRLDQDRQTYLDR